MIYIFYCQSVITTREFGRVVMRSVASVCASVCPVRALTFESLELEIPFLICR